MCYKNHCVVYLLSNAVNEVDCIEPSLVRSNFCHSISIFQGMTSITFGFLNLTSLSVAWV